VTFCPVEGKVEVHLIELGERLVDQPEGMVRKDLGDQAKVQKKALT